MSSEDKKIELKKTVRNEFGQVEVVISCMVVNLKLKQPIKKTLNDILGHVLNSEGLSCIAGRLSVIKGIKDINVSLRFLTIAEEEQED